MKRVEVKWRLAPDVPVGQAIVAATMRLKEEAHDTASLDAQVLLAHILEVDRSWLFAHHEYPLSAPQAEAYASMITRRMQHEPVAYLIGHKEFYGLDFFVDQRVLIPRPETELLVDAVLDEVEGRRRKPVRIADVGTGSGAIALAVAHNSADATIYALDISPDALAVARHNTENLSINGQVTLLQSDLLGALPEKVDIIAANLPYIASEVYCSLDSTVRDYEPKLALEAGPQGLDSIARLFEQAPHHLNPHGCIFAEIAFDQGKLVRSLAQKLLPMAKEIRLEKDYLDHDRIIRVRL